MRLGRVVIIKGDSRVRHVLVHARLVAAIEYDARAAGENELTYTSCAGSAEERDGAVDVNAGECGAGRALYERGGVYDAGRCALLLGEGMVSGLETSRQSKM